MTKLQADNKKAPMGGGLSTLFRLQCLTWFSSAFTTELINYSSESDIQQRSGFTDQPAPHMFNPNLIGNRGV